MAKAASTPSLYTLEELKKRGDHVIAQGLKAWRILNIATREGRELYNRIERIHHKSLPFESALFNEEVATSDRAPGGA
jgi:hypothetical protein